MRRDNPWARLTWGVIILTTGLLFWLDRMGRIEARDYLEYWPAALILMGLAHLPARRWGRAAVWIIIGVVFLSPVDPSQIISMWPLLITVAGVMLMLQGLRAQPSSGFRAVALMGANINRVRSQEFRGGQAVAVMGGCEIDLSNARPVDGAVIDVLAFWGGIEVKVPNGWRVVNRVVPILGGVDDKVAPAGENAPHIVLRGAVIMGGMGLRSA